LRRLSSAGGCCSKRRSDLSGGADGQADLHVGYACCNKEETAKKVAFRRPAPRRCVFVSRVRRSASRARLARWLCRTTIVSSHQGRARTSRLGWPRPCQWSQATSKQPSAPNATTPRQARPRKAGARGSRSKTSRPPSPNGSKSDLSLHGRQEAKPPWIDAIQKQPRLVDRRSRRGRSRSGRKWTGATPAKDHHSGRSGHQGCGEESRAYSAAGMEADDDGPPAPGRQRQPFAAPPSPVFRGGLATRDQRASLGPREFETALGVRRFAALSNAVCRPGAAGEGASATLQGAHRDRQHHRAAAARAKSALRRPNITVQRQICSGQSEPADSRPPGTEPPPPYNHDEDHLAKQSCTGREDFGQKLLQSPLVLQQVAERWRRSLTNSAEARRPSTKPPMADISR